MSRDSIFALFDAYSDEVDSDSDDKGKFEAKQDGDVGCGRHKSRFIYLIVIVHRSYFASLIYIRSMTSVLVL